MTKKISNESTNKAIRMQNLRNADQESKTCQAQSRW